MPIGICDLPGSGLLCDVIVGGVSDSVTDSIGKWIAKSAGDLAKSAVDLASRAVDKTTSIDLSADWFRTNYAAILPIALTMLVMTFIFQLVRAAWRRDGQALGQAVTGTVSATLFAMCAITFTGVAVVIVDALSRGLFQIANSNMDDAVRRIVRVSMIHVTSPLGWAVPAVVALGCAAGAILYWGAMVLRKVTVLVLVVLAPFAAAGGAWEPTRDWRRKWVEATATVVFSKLIMTVIMLVGVSALGESNTKDGVQALSDIISGLVIMALVLLSPMAIYKFVHWAGDGGQSHDLHRSTAAGLQAGAATAQKGTRMAMTAASGGAGAAAMGGGGASGAATGGGAPQGPAQVPGQDSPAGGNSTNSGGSESSPSQSTFRFPGTSSGSGGDAIGQPLITRRGARSGGDQGQPLISRAPTSGQQPGTPSEGSTTKANTALTAASAAGGSSAPQVVLGAARTTGSPSSAGRAETFPSAAAGPASAPSTSVGSSTPPTS
ncbi:conjugal transfer protein TrbL family protein [Kitasatospora sp. NPDC056446]|uniref:SCO6881 family protein n=1 Tax=Kitasatospora sp. NPDC056446 TaxID=3345819 RepID=UPI0036AA483A